MHVYYLKEADEAPAAQAQLEAAAAAPTAGTTIGNDGAGGIISYELLCANGSRC